MSLAVHKRRSQIFLHRESDKIYFTELVLVFTRDWFFCKYKQNTLLRISTVIIIPVLTRIN